MSAFRSVDNVQRNLSRLLWASVFITYLYSLYHFYRLIILFHPSFFSDHLIINQLYNNQSCCVFKQCFEHQLIKITDWTIDVVFSRFISI